MNYPKVLLLDEPLGALDLKLRKGLQVELKRIQREVGITFLYVTHDQEEALTMSDRIAVMNEGRVEQIGTAEDVYERPTTAFVAGFIGVSNLMPGVVASAGGEQGRIQLDSGVEVAVAADGLREGERCHAVVRPEKLRIALAGEAARGPGRALRRGCRRELGLPRHLDPDRRAGSPATCRSPCSSPTPTRPSASGCREAARGSS